MQHPIYSSFKWRQFGHMGWIPEWKVLKTWIEVVTEFTEKKEKRKKELLFRKFN